MTINACMRTGIATAALVVVFGLTARIRAQDPEAALQGDAEAGDTGGTDRQGEPAVAPVPPRPAENLAGATRSLLLAVTHTGDGYVAVGERGHILLSPDGNEWTQAPSPVRATLNAVFFANPKTGWAVGHDSAILKTTDGGRTWSIQHWKPEIERPLFDVYFFDTRRGIAVGAYGFYLNTADGGDSWTRVENDVTEDEWHFNSITRLGDGSLLLVGESGGVAHSADGGTTWTKIDSPYENGTFFGAVARGKAGAVLYGLRGHVYAVDDIPTATLESFEKVEIDTQKSFFGGTNMPDGTFLLVGENGVVARGGAKGMRLVPDPAGITLTAVVPSSGGAAIAVGKRGARVLGP